MRNGVLEQRYTNKVFLSIIDTLCNSIGYLVCFTQAVAYHTIAVTYNYDGRKAESSTTFHNFSNTVDSHYALFELNLACFNASDI